MIPLIAAPIQTGENKISICGAEEMERNEKSSFLAVLDM